MGFPNEANFPPNKIQLNVTFLLHEILSNYSSARCGPLSLYRFHSNSSQCRVCFVTLWKESPLSACCSWTPLHYTTDWLIPLLYQLLALRVSTEHSRAVCASRGTLWHAEWTCTLMHFPPSRSLWLELCDFSRRHGNNCLAFYYAFSPLHDCTESDRSHFPAPQPALFD